MGVTGAGGSSALTWIIVHPTRTDILTLHNRRHTRLVRQKIKGSQES